MSDSTKIREQLLSDHKRLERLFDSLIAAFEADDREGVCATWTKFDSELLAHIDVEERYLIPALLRTNEVEARAMLKEHELIRKRLLELGTCVDLHAVRAETARAFIDELRAHAHREDQMLYAWADEHVPESERASLIDSLFGAITARLPRTHHESQSAVHK